VNNFQNGERIIIIDGPFVDMEAIIKEIHPNTMPETTDLIEVIVKVFARDIPVVLESWQVEHA